jgi:MFS family permease
MGTVYTAFLVFYTCFMIPGGWLIDRIGSKGALAIMCGGSALFTAGTGLIGLAGLAPGALWVSLLVVRSLMGMTNAPLHPAGARFMADWFPRSAISLANGSVTFACCVGMGFVYLLFGALIDSAGWPTAFLITGAATGLLTIAWIVLAPTQPGHPISGHRMPDRGDPENDGFWRQLTNPNLLFLTISYSTVGYFQYLFFYWMEFYFERILELDQQTSRWLSTAMVLAMGVGMVVGGRLADGQVNAGGRHAHRVVPVACLLLSAIAVLVALLTGQYQLKIACFLLSMAAVGGTEGIYWTLGVRIGRSRGGTTAAIMNTGGNIGGLLAPIVTPILAAQLGWQAGLGTASAVCLVGAGLWFCVRNPERHPASESTIRSA